jgi:hypothetical protein
MAEISKIPPVVRHRASPIVRYVKGPADYGIGNMLFYMAVRSRLEALEDLNWGNISAIWFSTAKLVKAILGLGSARQVTRSEIAFKRTGSADPQPEKYGDTIYGRGLETSQILGMMETKNPDEEAGKEVAGTMEASAENVYS